MEQNKSRTKEYYMLGYVFSLWYVAEVSKITISTLFASSCQLALKDNWITRLQA